MSAETPPAGRLYILTVGFATTVAMWAVGYACRVPPAAIPGSVVLVLMFACLLVGGMTVGRHTRAGFRGGAFAGAVSALLNLLVLGSLITGGSAPNEVVPSALLWIPGFLLVSALVAGVGATIMHGRPGPQYTRETWRSGFVLVACVATLLVVIAGGVVTSTETGLAVPDWPNSFGSNMFLYPLSRMTGGIYFEHAHRLYGSLVGLTTVVLAATLWATDRRRWIRVLAVAAVVMVVAQGILGGLRVDSALTLSTDRAVTEPDLGLAIVHGVFAQVFFSTIVLLWAFTSRTWRESPVPIRSESAATEHLFTKVLVAAVFIQIVFGVLYRHLATDEVPMPWPAHAHLTLAAIVTVLAVITGLRAWAKYPETPVLRRLGLSMLVLISLQLVLGLAALVAVLAGRNAETPPPVEVLLATAHQANGALVLAVSVLLVAWTRRLLIAAPEVIDGTAVDYAPSP